MGEIKFRVWNEELEEMYELRKINYFGSTGIQDTYVGCDKAIWMQYTGLKDKNGVEIYEGDCFEKIFKMIEIPTGQTFEQTEVGVVKFDDGQFTCHIDGWGHAPLKDVLCYQNKNKDYWKDGLIIGNIYENLELLETKNLASATNTN